MAKDKAQKIPVEYVSEEHGITKADYAAALRLPVVQFILETVRDFPCPVPIDQHYNSDIAGFRDGSQFTCRELHLHLRRLHLARQKPAERPPESFGAKAILEQQRERPRK